MTVETATENVGKIIASDKNGEMVSPGDRVIYKDKVEMIRELYEENDHVRIGLEAWFGPYIVDEDEIELVCPNQF